jgi:hypothetical protein
MALDKTTKLALGLAALGGAIKIYTMNSTTLASDKKPQYETIGNFALYSGIGLASLFFLTSGTSGYKEF